MLNEFKGKPDVIFGCMENLPFIIAIVIPSIVFVSILVSVVRSDAKEKGRYDIRLIVACVIGFCAYLIYELFLTDKHGR